MRRTRRRPHSLQARLVASVATLVISSAPLFAQGSAELPIDADLRRAEAEILAGLSAQDFILKRQAVRMARYAGEGFERIALLFGSLDPGTTEPGEPLFRYDALETMSYLDRERTTQWLLDHNDLALERFDLYSLGAIIGFEAIPRFDNIFWAHVSSAEYEARSHRFYPILLAEHAVVDPDGPYLELLTWYQCSWRFSPEDMRFLHAYLTDRGLPTEMVRFTIEKRAGLLRGDEVIDRTFSFEELCFQGLLYRLGYATEPLARELVISVPGIPAGTRVVNQDPAQFSFLPSARINEAVALIYAGDAAPRDAETMLELLDDFDAPMRYRYIQTALSGPDSQARRDVARALLVHDEHTVRRMVSRALATDAEAAWRRADDFDRRGVGAGEAQLLLDRFEAESDPITAATLLEAIGSLGADGESTVINEADAAQIAARALDHSAPLVRVTAAGQLLRLEAMR